MRKFVSILIGSFLFATGINGFLIPEHLLDGGIVGISLIIKYLWGFKTGLTIILLSIPIYIIAWRYYPSYFFNSLHGLLFTSLLIDVLHPLQGMFHSSKLISSILGGALVGIGIGVMLREDTSTSGTDLLAQFLSRITKINVGLLIFTIDALVLMTGWMAIGDEKLVIYSAVVILIVGFMTTLLTYDVVKE